MQWPYYKYAPQLLRLSQLKYLQTIIKWLSRSQINMQYDHFSHIHNPDLNGFQETRLIYNDYLSQLKYLHARIN